MNQFDPNTGLLVPPTLNYDDALKHPGKCQCRKCAGDQPTDNRSAAADDPDVLVPPKLFG